MSSATENSPFLACPSTNRFPFIVVGRRPQIVERGRRVGRRVARAALPDLHVARAGLSGKVRHRQIAIRVVHGTTDWISGGLQAFCRCFGGVRVLGDRESAGFGDPDVVRRADALAIRRAQAGQLACQSLRCVVVNENVVRIPVRHVEKGRRGVGAGRNPRRPVVRPLRRRDELPQTTRSEPRERSRWRRRLHSAGAASSKQQNCRATNFHA